MVELSRAAATAYGVLVAFAGPTCTGGAAVCVATFIITILPLPGCVTYAFVPSGVIAIFSGACVSEMLPATARGAVLTMVTCLVPFCATQIALPSGVTAMPVGREPAGSGSVFRMLRAAVS